MGLRGAGGVKNFSVGICDGAPSTARSSFHLNYVVDRHNATALARDKQYCGNGDFFKLLMNREMVKIGFNY